MLVWTQLPHNWSRGTLTNSGRGGGAKLLWAEPAQGPGNPKGHRPRLQPLLDCGTRPAWLPRQEGEGRGAKGSGRRGSLAAARLTSTVSGEGGWFGGLSLLFKGPWEPVAGCGHYRLQGPSAHISHASNGEGTPQRSQGLAEDPKNASYLSAEQPADTRQAGCTPRGQGTEGVATPGRGGHSRRDLEGGAGLHRRRVGGGDPACGRKAPEMRIHA